MRLSGRARLGAVFVVIVVGLVVTHLILRGTGPRAAFAPGAPASSADAPTSGTNGPAPAPPPHPTHPTLLTPTTASPPTPGSPASTAGGRGAHAKPIGWEGLVAGAVTFPAWPAGAGCHHRDVRLAEPTAQPAKGTVVLVATDKGDVNGDGVKDTVAILHCVGSPGPMQAVAFTRDPAGRIVALGRVTVDQRRMLLGVEVLPNGAVQIGAVDHNGREEWQTYRWTGTAFARVV
jgi:hypothetical protein